MPGTGRMRLRLDQGGQALLVVLVVLALLSTVPLVIVTSTVGQLPLTTQNLNWDTAFEAAQSGMGAFLQQLDADANQIPPQTNGWVSLSTSPASWYEYIGTSNQGLVTLTVSGKAGQLTASQVVRTFVYTIRPRTSLDTVYWTNYEVMAPAVAETVNQRTDCSGASYPKYYGQGSVPSDCEIQFYTGDVVDGPLFTNDTIRACGTPDFESTVTSGNEYSATIWTEPQSECGNGGANPTFISGQPTHGPYLTPQSSTVDLTPAQDYGCYITGNASDQPASTVTITLNGSTLTWSGGVLKNASSNPNSAAACGGASGGGTVTFAALKSALIYVNASTVDVSGEVTGDLDIVTNNNTANGTSNIDLTGNVYYPSGDITTAADGTESDPSDALGLIAEDSIVVPQPSGNTPFTVDAALLALGGSFYVNQWSGGTTNFPALTVFGSIAQDYRGPVGTTGGTGYSKNYHWDSSLLTLWPPYFIPPQGATWSPVTYQELAGGASNEAIAGS